MLWLHYMLWLHCDPKEMPEPARWRVTSCRWQMYRKRVTTYCWINQCTLTGRSCKACRHTNALLEAADLQPCRPCLLILPPVNAILLLMGSCVSLSTSTQGHSAFVCVHHWSVLYVWCMYMCCHLR